MALGGGVWDFPDPIETCFGFLLKLCQLSFKKQQTILVNKKFIEIENEDCSSYALLWLLSLDSDFLLRFLQKYSKTLQ